MKVSVIPNNFYYSGKRLAWVMVFGTLIKANKKKKIKLIKFY